MHAAVLVKPKTLVAQEFARPTIGPDDALLRLEACGICGSDYEQYEGAQPYPFDKMHTCSLPLEETEDAIRTLAGEVPGVNPIHLAIVPGAPRVSLRR